MERFDLLIRNARLVDPQLEQIREGSVYIREGRLCAAPEGDYTALRIVDADGMYVCPGLIDFHAHPAMKLYGRGFDLDSALLPNGVTAVVDQGSLGARRFAEYRPEAAVHWKAFVNVDSAGLEQRTSAVKSSEEELRTVIDEHSQRVLGLKVRVGHWVDNYGMEPLRQTRRLADTLRVPMCAHVVWPDEPYEYWIGEFRSGDILAHCFQGHGPTILTPRGKIVPEVLEASARGVLMDFACGRANHSLEVARVCVQNGFFPDILSTDLVGDSLYAPIPFSLGQVISIFLELGMPLEQVIRSCTDTPATAMRMRGEIGCLSPGSAADLCLFTMEKKDWLCRDEMGGEVMLQRVFAPQMTILGGRIAYCRLGYGIR